MIAHPLLVLRGGLLLDFGQLVQVIAHDYLRFQKAREFILNKVLPIGQRLNDAFDPVQAGIPAIVATHKINYN